MTLYSFNDIGQYLRGELPPAEMHAIEKASLQDPFLADAIEGYRSAGILTANADLSAVHEQLPVPKTVPAHTGLSMGVKSVALLKAAAAVIVVAGATTLGWVIMNNEKQESKQEQAVISEKKKDTAQKDIIAVLAKKEPAKTQSLSEAPLMKMVPSPGIKGYDTIIKRMEEYQVKPVAGGKNMTPFTITVTINTIATNTPAEIASVKRFDSLLAGVGARLITPAKDLLQQVPGVQLDRKGIVAQNGKTVPKVLVDGKEFFSDDIISRPLPEIKDTIVRGSALNDVVVIGYGSNRNRDAAKKNNLVAHTKGTVDIRDNITGIYFPPAISSHISRATVSKAGLAISPAQGWPEFNRYLSEKLSLVQSDIATANDSLAIKVSVDKTGKVINAGIERSFNPALNDKLIKAITEGPGWVNLSGMDSTFMVIITVYR